MQGPGSPGVFVTMVTAIRGPGHLGAELRQLRELGVGVAIDDFGSGYSPLGLLRELPVDVIKLDRSLVADIDTNKGNQHLVAGVIGLAHELGFDVVAEGVERNEEQSWCSDHGVHLIQGFLRGRPKPIADLLAEQADVLTASHGIG